MKMLTPTICTFPQYHYCGNSNCKLADKCSDLPYLQNNTLCKQHLKVNIKNKSYTEIKRHQALYQFYNRFFGDLREKQKIYHKLNYHKRIPKRNEPDRRRLTKLLQNFCDGNCESCKYDDCILPEYENHSEYYKLYSLVNRDRLYQNKSEYRKAHKESLSNKEIIRQYKKKGIIMCKCFLSETDNPKFISLLNMHGSISVFPINGNNYVRFISEDKNHSFRFKISTYLNDLSYPGCTTAFYKDTDGYSYVFCNPDNINPLWETEHQR